jgi:hypothetical protein
VHARAAKGGTGGCSSSLARQQAGLEPTSPAAEEDKGIIVHDAGVDDPPTEPEALSPTPAPLWLLVVGSRGSQNFHVPRFRKGQLSSNALAEHQHVVCCPLPQLCRLAPPNPLSWKCDASLALHVYTAMVGWRLRFRVPKIVGGLLCIGVVDCIMLKGVVSDSCMHVL